MANKSTAIAIHPVHAMLYGALRQYVVDNRRDVDPKALWLGSDPDQKAWLAALHSISPDYRDVLGKRIKAFGSTSREECNDFLKKEGFSIELGEFQGDNPVGGVSTMHVGVEWEFAGDKTSIYRSKDDGSYEMIAAAELSGGLTYLKSTKHENPIVRIATKGTDAVYMTIADKPLDGLALLNRVVEISGSSSENENAYWDGLRFPLIDLDVEPDMSGLCGLTLPRTQGRPYTLFQCLAQVKFKANHLGAQTDAAAAGQMGIESGPQFVTMKDPFFVWKTVKGLTLPVLAAYVAEDAWKDPGDFAINNG